MYACLSVFRVRFVFEGVFWGREPLHNNCVISDAKDVAPLCQMNYDSWFLELFVSDASSLCFLC